MEEEIVIPEEELQPVEEPEAVEGVEEETTEEPGTATEEVVEEQPKTVPVKAVIEEKRKRQEAEQKAREMEERLARIEQEREASKPKSLQDLYDDNPEGVTQYINGEIERLVREDPVANAGQIEQLRDHKVILRDNNRNNQAIKAKTFVEELSKDIPDFVSKRDKLTEYAVKELGYTNEELLTLSNPDRVGASAARKFIASVNKQFDKDVAAQTVTKKTVPKKPVQSEAPGEGATPAPASKQLTQAYEKAKTSGDWSEVLRLRGIAA